MNEAYSYIGAKLLHMTDIKQIVAHKDGDQAIGHLTGPVQSCINNSGLAATSMHELRTIMSSAVCQSYSVKRWMDVSLALPFVFEVMQRTMAGQTQSC